MRVNSFSNCVDLSHVAIQLQLTITMSIVLQ